ncbi:MAG TPA: hypothetical protein VKP65_25765, partial [Rhodothermales bacterium]|nr:hypothetical protein [Rhodothermales bacterium]
MATVIVKKGGAQAAVSTRRARERRWLLAVTVVVACGLLLLGVKQARDFGDVRARLDNGEIVNLNALERTNQEALNNLFENVYEDPVDRTFLASRIAERVQEQGGVPNVGALNGLVTAEEIAEEGGARYQERLAATNEQLGLTPTVVAHETRAEPPTYPS